MQKYCPSEDVIFTEEECELVANKFSLRFQGSAYNPLDHPYCVFDTLANIMYFNNVHEEDVQMVPPNPNIKSYCGRVTIRTFF